MNRTIYTILYDSIVIYPFGYNNNNPAQMDIFPQCLFGEDISVGRYISHKFEIVIKNLSNCMNNLSVKLVHDDCKILTIFNNYFAKFLSDKIHIIVEDEFHELHHTHIDINERNTNVLQNLDRIKYHKRRLIVSFDDNIKNYIYNTPIFCFSQSFFRRKIDTSFILGMHKKILTYMDREIFVTDSFIIPTKPTICKRVPQIINKRIPQKISEKDNSKKISEKWDQIDNSKKISEKWDQMVNHLLEKDIRPIITDIFTPTFFEENKNNIFSSKYFGGFIDGLSMLDKIIVNDSTGTIFISKTNISKYVFWVVETFYDEQSSIEEGEILPLKTEGLIPFREIIPLKTEGLNPQELFPPGELLGLNPEYKPRCVVGFYQLSMTFEGIFINFFQDNAHENPFLKNETLIAIDHTPSVAINFIVTSWEKRGVKPLILR